MESLSSAVNVLIRLYGAANVIGAVTPPGLTFNGIKNIDRQDLKSVDFDLILVTGRNASLQPVLKEVAALGIDADKVVLDRTVCVPFFTLEKYQKLRHSRLSIFSKNCFAGLLYHRLGLPFLSPTVNMFTSDEGFMKFIESPIANISKELIFQEMRFYEDENHDYPVFKLGDTLWYMNHFKDINVAFRKWYERAFRINWFNLLVVTYTDRSEILAEFDKLPFAKKVCFVPFETDLDSGFQVDTGGMELWRVVNDGIARGAIIRYDLWDMLLYGKKTPVIKK